MSARGAAPAHSPTADLLERAARALREAPAGPLVLSVAAPDIDPLSLLAADDDAWLWTDRDGRVTVGAGSVLGIGATGDARFRTVLARARDLPRFRSEGAAEVAPPPRLIGGGAFAPTERTPDDWRDFADLWFTLPRLAWYDDDAAGPRLQIALSEGDDDAIRRRTLAALERLLATTTPPPRSATLRGAIDAPAERDRWRPLVGRALSAIESGAASKIVLARSARLTADRAIGIRALAQSLLRADGTFRYLVAIGDVVFAGASPERLVEKRGDAVRTEAVAGTAAVGHEETPLEQREKDRREHLAVVLAIDESLAPHTLALEHADEPLVRRVGRVEHLVTPFAGRVDPAMHVLELAAALHPTPAVAGTPRDVALDFIASNEGLRRGWFAGPIGWFDANGDGELAVALRCVRIEGPAVDVYAGAGIVSGSDPDAEFDETVLKMRSTLAALGFELSP